MFVNPVTSFPSDGLQTASARFGTQAEALANSGPEPEEVVALMESQRAFEASAAATTASSETLGTVLDAFA